MLEKSILSGSGSTTSTLRVPRPSIACAPFPPIKATTTTLPGLYSRLRPSVIVIMPSELSSPAQTTQSSYSMCADCIQKFFPPYRRPKHDQTVRVTTSHAPYLPGKVIAYMGYRTCPPRAVTIMADGQTLLYDLRGGLRLSTIATSPRTGAATGLTYTPGQAVTAAVIDEYLSQEGLTESYRSSQHSSAMSNDG